MWSILGTINTVVFVISIVLLLIAIAPRARSFTGTALVYLSFAYGISLFIGGFAITLGIWGWLGVVVGLLLAGIGVAPVGAIAALTVGEWGAFWALVILGVLTFGTRAVGLLVAQSGENQKYEHVEDTIDVGDTSAGERTWKDLG